MTIDEVYKFVNFVSNKVQSGGTITATNFNLLAQRAQIQAIENDFSLFLKTKSVSEFLADFIKSTSIIIATNGRANYPSDFSHVVDMKYYYVRPDGTGVFVPVSEIENEQFSAIESSQLNKPTKRFPKYVEFASYLEFLPRNLALVTLDYVKVPASPVWAYTIQNGVQVYDPSNSVQFEASDFGMNRIIAIILSLVGINIREGDLVQYAQLYKQENQ